MAVTTEHFHIFGCVYVTFCQVFDLQRKDSDGSITICGLVNDDIFHIGGNRHYIFAGVYADVFTVLIFHRCHHYLIVVVGEAVKSTGFL